MFICNSICDILYVANSCTNGAVRLTTEGTVEVCYNGGWTTVSLCDSN